VAYADQLTEAASTNPRCISRPGRRVAGISDVGYRPHIARHLQLALRLVPIVFHSAPSPLPRKVRTDRRRESRHRFTSAEQIVHRLNRIPGMHSVGNRLSDELVKPVNEPGRTVGELGRPAPMGEGLQVGRQLAHHSEPCARSRLVQAPCRGRRRVFSKPPQRRHLRCSSNRDRDAPREATRSTARAHRSN
jgi:hypothetical protein